MHIPVEVEVHCSDGLCGRSTHVLVDVRRKEVTHLVIKESEPPHEERIVPIEAVVGTAPDVILLRATKAEVSKMEPFNQTTYLREEMPDVDYAPSGYVPFGTYWVWLDPLPPRTQVVSTQYKKVPLGELAIERGTHVKATDGRVGRVDELIVDPEDEHITHLVMREGHLWGQKEIAIPISEIDRIEEDTVHLKLSKDEVEALPAVPVNA
jgi:sporulation protein YlmC with PRC-barrel domain